MRLRVWPLQVLQQPRQLEHGGCAAAIVVGARRVLGAVVMRADDDDVRIGNARLRLDHGVDVAHRLAADDIFLPAGRMAV